MAVFDQSRRLKHLRLISIFVDNRLDEDVTVQVKANRIQDTEKAVNVCPSFTVAAGGSEARSYSVTTSGWLPYVYVEAQCATAPTEGYLDVYRITFKNQEDKLVDGLKITDTDLHSPQTDSNKILIQEWS